MRECHVYIIGHEHSTYGHAVKVGIAESPAVRLTSLQTGSCEDLSLFFSFKLPNRQSAMTVERRFHEHFYDWRIRGEWFGMPPNGAIMLLSFFVAEILRETMPQAFLPSARADAGLLTAFDILDRLPSDDQTRWTDEWTSHVIEAREQ